MRWITPLSFVCICLIFVNAVCSYETNKKAVAVQASGTILIDGHDDESFWSEAPLAPGSFWNREDGSQMTVQTDVKAAYDEQNLYVYVYAHDASKITMATKTEDGFAIFQYDCISIEVFAPGAQINWFAVEPKGGKVFYIGSGSGANPDVEIGTAVFPGQGWAAEYRLSWKTVDIPLIGEAEIKFGVDRRKQNPWQWGDLNYIGKEENLANMGTLKVVLPTRSLDASLTLEGTVKHNFDPKDEEEDTEKHGTATLFLTSQSLRATLSAFPYDKDLAQEIASVAHSYFPWKYSEYRNLLLENNSIFTRNQPGYYSLWGNSLFYSPTIGEIKAGSNLVYKNKFLTLGSIATVNENEEKNLVLRSLGTIGGTTLGGHLMARQEEDSTKSVGSIDVTHKGKGYMLINELAYSGSDWAGLREEGKLAYFYKKWEASFSWLLKGEDHNNPFAYDPLPDVYGVSPALGKKFNWEKGLVKEFSVDLWTDWFRYWKEDKSFYTSLGSRLWVETQKIKGINYAAYTGIEKSSFAQWDDAGIYQRYQDQVSFTRLFYNFRGENKFHVYYRFGRVSDHDIQTFSFWGQLNGGLTGIEALKKLTWDATLEHESHWSTKNQLITSLNFGKADQYGFGTRYVWREVDQKRKINNVYLAGWFVQDLYEIHGRFGLPNKESFVPDLGFKVVGKLPLTQWLRSLI